MIQLDRALTVLVGSGMRQPFTNASRSWLSRSLLSTKSNIPPMVRRASIALGYAWMWSRVAKRIAPTLVWRC
jgi:hypothetical protein